MPPSGSTPTIASRRAVARYQGADGEAYHHGKRAIPTVAEPWVCRARAALFQPEVGPDQSVLEWGCGAGWNLAGLRAARRVGLDVAPSVREAVERWGVEFLTTTEALGEARFDVVLSHHSLEHVPDPLSVLVEVHRLLRPGGRLLLAVPYEVTRAQRRYDPAEPNHHLFAWSPQALGNLVALAGFRVDAVGLRPYGYDRAAALQAVRLRLGEGGFRAIRWLARAMFPLREVHLRATRPPGGSSPGSPVGSR